MSTVLAVKGDGPRQLRAASLADVLDRILDKGMRFDASVRVSLVGVELIGVEVSVTVLSLDLHLALEQRCPTCDAQLRPSETPSLWEGWEHPYLFCVNGCHVPWSVRDRWMAAFAAGDTEAQRRALRRIRDRP